MREVCIQCAELAKLDRRDALRLADDFEAMVHMAERLSELDLSGEEYGVKRALSELREDVALQCTAGQELFQNVPNCGGGYVLVSKAKGV